MGYGTAARHEPIGRRIALPVPMRIEDVVLRPHEAYPDIPPSFHCRPLLADISAATCRSNFMSHKSVSCGSCPVGMMHSDLTERSAIRILNDASANRHERAAAKNSLSCIRCEKSAKTNLRLVGAMRIVSGGTICVSCFNRERECVKGVNSKGARPRLTLHQAIITYKVAGKRKVVEDIGLRIDHLECHRYVARVHPGATLLEAVIDGETVGQFSLWTPPPFSPWEPKPAKTRKRMRTYAPRSHRALAIEHEAMQPHAETYPDNMPVQPATPSADVPATAASVEVAEAASVDSELSEQEIEPSEWEGCHIIANGQTIYVTDYASEHGISDEAAAIELGLCDPHYEDEPGPAPIAQLAFERKGAAPKERTGKALRKQQKREAREARIAEQAARGIPATKPAAAAIAARGLVLCMQYAAQIQKVGA
ncbi:hypothetical protein SAMN05444172_1596 [Burkholderia sp. GAS332]|nr:hypothetical protein SAMN05444172_1596 [Burkholderia sp. GAS332]